MRTALNRIMVLCLTVCLGMIGLAQETDSEQGPDLINTLGVGARAVAMGDAYTAIADDPSATFWNPARLGEIPFLQVMVEGRNVLRISQVTGEALPDYWDPGNLEEDGITRLPMKFSFAGFSKSIGDWEPNVGSRGGTLGVSYTLGGYFDFRSRFNMPGDPIEGEETAAIFQEDRLVQNHFLTVAWGKNLLIARNPSVRRVTARRAPKPAAAPAPAPVTVAAVKPSTTPLVATPGTEFIAGTDARQAEIDTMRKVVPDAYTEVKIPGTNEVTRVPVEAPKPAVVTTTAAPAPAVEIAQAPAEEPAVEATTVERKGRIYKIGVGVGGYAVMQTQEKRSASVVKMLGPNGVDDLTIGDTIIDDTIVPGTEVIVPPLDSSGTGYGFIIGLTAELWGYRSSQGDEMLPEGGRLRYGLTYRSKADIGGLITQMPDDTDFDMGDEFGREIPSRITFGVAYEYTEPEESVMQSETVRAPRQLTMSAEAQYFSKANDTPFALDKRKSITNFGFGIEYIPTRQWLPIPFLRRLTYDESKLAYVEPIRLGVRTNQAGNVYGIFQDDVVVSGGLALYYSALNGGARGNYTFSFEPTAEYFIESGQTIYTLSTNYRF
ncbi:MAG: hypothetical protein ACYDCO_00675 [Armatimonadota bacterium]